MADVNGASAKPSQTHLPSPNTSQSNAVTPPPPNTTNTTSPDQPQTSQSQGASNTQATNTTSAAADSQNSTNGTAAPPAVPTSIPATSLADAGTSARPRDARTIHMVLAALGVTAYQERVPLQLLDFAYRYTASVLSDAQHLSGEGYVAAGGSGAGSSKKSAAAAAAEEGVSLAAIRLATSSRLGHQFGGAALPKETLLELGAERNRVKLPQVDKETSFGVRLPHERFVMTGNGWNLPEEWDSEEVEEVDAGKKADGVNGGAGGAAAAAAAAASADELAEEEADEDAEMADEPLEPDEEKEEEDAAVEEG